MSLDHDFVQAWKFSEDQKKANGTLFFPNPGEDQKKNKVFIRNRTLFPQIQVQTKKKGFHQKYNTFSPNSGGNQKKINK